MLGREAMDYISDAVFIPLKDITVLEIFCRYPFNGEDPLKNSKNCERHSLAFSEIYSRIPPLKTR